jgi:hypothetical protein
MGLDSCNFSFVRLDKLELTNWGDAMKCKDKMQCVAERLSACGYTSTVSDNVIDIWLRPNSLGYIELTECYQDESDWLVFTGWPLSDDDDVEINMTDLITGVDALIVAIESNTGSRG